MTAAIITLAAACMTLIVLSGITAHLVYEARKAPVEVTQ
jgi:hypothetical protein